MANEVIKIKDLRIGNILLYKGGYVHVTNISCDIDDEYTDMIGFCKLGETSDEVFDWNRTLCKDLSVVPLNENVLKKLGFKDFSFPRNRLAYRLRFDDSRELAWYMQDEFLRYQAQLGGFTTVMPHINTLHRVQNFFYNLTGTEIKFKP